jgi:hypothetical protein
VNTILDQHHYVPQIACSNGAAVNNATSLTVHVNAGDHVTCTITNTRKAYKP